MDTVNVNTQYDTLIVQIDGDICVIQIHRPSANNTINDQLVTELLHVVTYCEAHCKIVVLEGSPDTFCFGADFATIRENFTASQNLDTLAQQQDPGPLYDLWLKLTYGSFVSIAHVRGKTNAGGVGFVACCDLVLAEEKAVFSLSELLFGLMPACVIPFLTRRIGAARCNYLSLMTQPITARQAENWGLVDACEENSQALLRRHLLRLRRLNKTAIQRYKRYLLEQEPALVEAKSKALAANKAVFADDDNLARIARYAQTGELPWESSNG